MSVFIVVFIVWFLSPFLFVIIRADLYSNSTFVLVQPMGSNYVSF